MFYFFDLGLQKSVVFFWSRRRQTYKLTPVRMYEYLEYFENQIKIVKTFINVEAQTILPLGEIVQRRQCMGQISQMIRKSMHIWGIAEATIGFG